MSEANRLHSGSPLLFYEKTCIVMDIAHEKAVRDYQSGRNYDTMRENEAA